MKSILVATDLSARSEGAIRRAASLAAKSGAQLTVLHVIDEAQPDAEQRGRAAEAKIGSLGPGISVRLMRGKHIDAIEAAAQEAAADLIVIGKHRPVEAVDLFRGSTGERVIRFGTRPVLLVKQAPDAPYARVLVAVDFSPPARQALEYALANFADAELTLVHAFHTVPRTGMADRLERQFAEFFAGLELPPTLRKVTEEGAPVPTLLKAIAGQKPDLVVVGTHGRSSGAPVQIGTVAERILSDAECDIVAVRV